MKCQFGDTVVVALGGSIIFPENIDWRFLRRFKKFILPQLKKRKFILVAGGGRLSRKYQEAAGKVSRLTDEDKDWLGIHATRSNAHLLRTIFRGIADPVVIDERWRIKKLRYPVTVASGWKPGWSTDYIAVRLAADFGVGEVVVAGRPDYVYDRDHATYKNAKPILRLDWKTYRKTIPARWVPGAHAPVDPVAAKLAAEEKLKALIVGGKNLENLGKLLQGKDFKGTIIAD